jgi:hypothetical protein
MFNNPKRSKKENGRARTYRVANRLEVKAGRMVRQAGTESRDRQVSKPGGLEKGEYQRQATKSIYKTNWPRDTGNTGINTLAQRDMKHRDKYTGTERQETQG